MSKIEIPLSKTKILLLTIGSCLFIAISVFFLANPDVFVSPILKDPRIVFAIGILGAVFFTATGIYGIKKMSDNKAGLIIDAEGIIDNTNATSIGLIKWAEITEIRTEQVMSNKFIVIFIKDPEVILNRVTGFKKQMLIGNLKMFGTPISITSSTLKYNFDSLEKLLTDRLDEERLKHEVEHNFGLPWSATSHANLPTS